MAWVVQTQCMAHSQYNCSEPIQAGVLDASEEGAQGCPYHCCGQATGERAAPQLTGSSAAAYCMPGHGVLFLGHANHPGAAQNPRPNREYPLGGEVPAHWAECNPWNAQMHPTGATLHAPCHPFSHMSRPWSQPGPYYTWAPGHRPWEMSDLVLMNERPLLTAALVFSRPSFVPSLAAFMSFCICNREGDCMGWGHVGDWPLLSL